MIPMAQNNKKKIVPSWSAIAKKAAVLKLKGGRRGKKFDDENS